jgi:uncharacterized membrane protein YfcA
MTDFWLTTIVGAGALAAGLLGSLTGLDGGVVIVPLLVLGLGVDLRYAAGASLVAVIATSSGAAATYVREGYTNIRIGMFLEVATTVGAIGGASLAAIAPGSVVAVIFGVVLLASVYWSGRPSREPQNATPPDKLATVLRLDGTQPTPDGPRPYHVRHIPLGFGLMLVAGVLSGLLGIGSGALKVLAMDQAMRIPFKVSTTTSNFMIGVTAAASAGIYLRRGFIDPGLAMPVVLGVLAGSAFGAHLLARMDPVWLRRLFAVVILALGIQMIYKGLTGGL